MIMKKTGLAVFFAALMSVLGLTSCLNGDGDTSGNHTIFRLDTHLNLTYLCAVTFNNNDYGKRKSKLPGGI